MLLQSYLSQANFHLATRLPIPSELLKKWQKRVGKKGVKTTLYKSPSPVDDSDSDFPPLQVGPITPLITYTTRSLAALPGGDANAVAGPSTLHHDRADSEVIEIEGAYFHCFSSKLLKILIPDSDSTPRQERTASPTIGIVENLNASFSGSFYVDESLKALNPWDASAVNEAWEF